MNDERSVSIYLPERYRRGTSICTVFCADGQAIGFLAGNVAAAIERGSIPPVALVGVDGCPSTYSIPGGPNDVLVKQLATKLAARFYLAAGNAEPPFSKSTMRMANILKRHAVEHVYHERAGGHNLAFWSDEFPLSLGWAFGSEDA